ncbi:MAG: YcgN family cysteine cluster protein [Minwuia sp.]|nr:YcgN family cysteine cluster protein [Minwuia sp.]
MNTNTDEDERPFWETTRLEDMTQAQWESLCDGCGKCCLYKLEDIDTGEIVFTNVACRLLDHESCRCGDYANRSIVVPDCLTLDTENVGKLRWMPSTCAYRLLYEGKPLEPWHPLVSGNPDSVHWAGISIRGRCISEDEADEDLENHALDGEP